MTDNFKKPSRADMNTRKTVRLSIKEIPEILQKPIVLIDDKEVKSEIENLSPLGIGINVDINISVTSGDFFYLKYYDIDSYIKCLCVFSEETEGKRSIGAYFTDPEDQKIIFKHLKHQTDN